MWKDFDKPKSLPNLDIMKTHFELKELIYFLSFQNRIIVKGKVFLPTTTPKVVLNFCRCLRSIFLKINKKPQNEIKKE